jgi:hypothetical protein
MRAFDAVDNHLSRLKIRLGLVGTDGFDAPITIYDLKSASDLPLAENSLRDGLAVAFGEEAAITPLAPTS